MDLKRPGQLVNTQKYYCYRKKQKKMFEPKRNEKKKHARSTLTINRGKTNALQRRQTDNERLPRPMASAATAIDGRAVVRIYDGPW